MANYFELIGKIIPLKRKDKPAVERNEYESGWMNTTVNFLCLAGEDSVICRVQGGKWKDDKKNAIKTMSVRRRQDDGTLTESVKIDIPWDERFDKEQIEKVAGYKKFTFDLSNNTTRKYMNYARSAVRSEDWENNALKMYPFQSEAEADERITAEYAKRHQFLSEYDFAEYLADYIEHADSNTVFCLKGSYDIQFSVAQDRFYATYHVTSISKAEHDAKPSATFNNLSVYIAKDFIDDEDVVEQGKANIHGWLQYYDSSVKKTGFTPIVIALYGDQKKIDYFKAKTKDMTSEIGRQNMVVDIINQTEYREITMDDLSDEEREDIECGLRTFEDVKKAYHGRIAGGRITELRFVKLGKDNLVETDYTVDDMVPAKADVSLVDDIDVFDDDEL